MEVTERIWGSVDRRRSGCSSVMSSADLFRVARAVLEAPSSTPPTRTAAVDALLFGLTEGVPLPEGTAWLIWRFWTAAPSNRSWRYAGKLGEVADVRVRADAIEILEREHAGAELRELAIDVLVGKAHARHVEDRLLLGLVERARSAREAEEAFRLLEAVHAARGVDAATLRDVRDRWARSPTAGIREAAISIAGQLVEENLSFVEKMLSDPDSDVRVAMAYRLDVDFPGHEATAHLIEARLNNEQHPRARCALLRALASVIEAAETKSRRPR